MWRFDERQAVGGRVLAMVSCAVLLAAAGGRAEAADSTWNAATANWSGSGVWLNQEPSGAYDAVIDNGGTAQITNTNYEAADDLFLGNTPGHSGYVTIEAGGHLYVDHYINVGYAGTGGLTQTGGEVYASYGLSSYDLRLGYQTGSHGTYTMSGGTCQAADQYVGYDGTGTFTQTGGTNYVGWSDSLHHLYIGKAGTGTGTYRLGGATSQLTMRHASGNIYVGGGGGGRFEWFRTNGGGLSIGASGAMVFATNGVLAMGYDFSVATLMANGYVVTEGLAAAKLEVTNGATATMNSGDIAQVAYLSIGTVGLSGAGVQNNGTLTVDQDMKVGEGGTGTHTQHNGSTRATQHLYLGVAGGTGNYILNGGAFRTGTMMIGTDGTGTFTQGGGTNTTDANFFLGSASTGGALRISAGSATVGGYVSGADNGSIVINGGSLSVTGSVTVKNFTLGDTPGYSGAWTLGTGKSLAATNETIGQGGTGTFTQSGGTNNVTNLTIGSGSSYSMSGGTLTAGAVVVGQGGSATLDIAGQSPSVGSLTLKSGLVAGTTGTITATSPYVVESGTVSARLAGGVGLTKQTAGNATLSGANSYTGNTAVNLGKLTLGAAGTLPWGSGKGNVSVDGTLDIGGANQDINGLSGTGVVDNGVGAGTYTLTVGNNGAGGTFGGVIQNTSGALALSKVGAGTLVLSNANTFGGNTRIGGGVLSLNHALALQNSTVDLNAADAGTLDLNGLSATLGGLAGSRNLTIPSGRTLTIGNNGAGTTYSGALDGGGSGGGLTKVGAGASILSGPCGYGGTTIVSGGTLQIGAGGTSGWIDTDVQVDAGLAFNRSDDVAFARGISGTGSLTKFGLGKLTLSGGSSYGGATYVNGGRLLVNSTHSGLGLFSVGPAAWLGGTGSVGGSVRLLAGAYLAPGASIGTFTVGGDVMGSGTLVGGTFKIELGDKDGGEDFAGLSDRLDVGGALDITRVTVDFDVLGTPRAGAYVFAGYGSLIGTKFLTVLDLPKGYSIDYNYQNANRIALVVPEPATLGVLVIGGLALFVRRRR